MLQRFFEAISIGLMITEDISHNGTIGYVHAVFDNSFHVLTSYNNMLCIVNENLFPGPLNVVIQLPASTSVHKLKLKHGQRVDRIDDLLIVGNGVLTISLKRSKLWTAKHSLHKMLSVKKIAANKAFLRQIVENTFFGYCFKYFKKQSVNDNHAQNRYLHHRFLPMQLEGLLDAIRQGNLEAVTETARGLVGLGPGLTPLMDDILMGLITGMIHLSLQFNKLNPYASKVAASILAANGKTTLLSRALMKAAATGETGEPVRALIEAVFSTGKDDIEAEAKKVLKIGGTSGKATAFGLVLGLELGLFFLGDSELVVR
ncbi:MAG: DUF2877 domain-containing protein [Candidatus Ranarchaeia archaeon]